MALMGACTKPPKDDSPALMADGEYLVYLAALDLATMQVTVDELEWINPEDSERITQLGLDPEYDFPNGYYIHNEEERWLDLPLAADADLEIIHWGLQVEPIAVSPEELQLRLQESPLLMNMTVSAGIVTELKEQYVP